MFLKPQISVIPVKDKMDAGQALKVSRMKEVIKPTHPHRHADYHELILLDQGAGFHQVDDQNFEVIAPVMYYLRPGQTHCWNFSAIPKGYVVLFREELLLKEDLDSLYDLPAQISLNEQRFLFDLLAELYDEFKLQNSSTEVYKAYLHLLIVKLKELSRTGKTVNHNADALFRTYKRLVNSHFAQSRQLAFYAGKLNITTAVLNDSCKKAVMKTALAIINERVLLEAKLLLSATNKPISTIALDLNFSDSPHFIKFFKRYTNVTPGQYRDLALKKK